MKLPAVAIAALFACGVVLAQTPWFAGRIPSHTYSQLALPALLS
jgi:hypothetical protein